MNLPQSHQAFILRRDTYLHRTVLTGRLSGLDGATIDTVKCDREKYEVIIGKSEKTSWRTQDMSCSVAQSCLPLCNPMDCSTPGSLSFTFSWSLLKLMSIELVMPSNHLILCHRPFLLSSVFPSIRVFFSESALHFRWPKYWSFSFSVSPSNEYSGLIPFRIDWFDLLTVQGTLNSPPTLQFN